MCISIFQEKTKFSKQIWTRLLDFNFVLDITSGFDSLLGCEANLVDQNKRILSYRFVIDIRTTFPTLLTIQFWCCKFLEIRQLFDFDLVGYVHWTCLRVRLEVYFVQDRGLVGAWFGSWMGIEFGNGWKLCWQLVGSSVEKLFGAGLVVGWSFEWDLVWQFRIDWRRL